MNDSVFDLPLSICVSKSNDPYFNLATEEFLLKQKSENVFFVYINEPSVIIGKHQNTLAEVNYPFIKENNIHVVRRISGGGTVYHDHGNINFCFITNGKTGYLIDFAKQTKTIIAFLRTIGVNAEFKGHNDLRVKDLKISGNAEHVFKKRVLHHGTLLFNSDLAILNDSIKVKLGAFKDKAVQSVRTSVTNISEYTAHNITAEEFAQQLIDYHVKNNSNSKYISFSQADIKDIESLQDNKYKTWEWNYGYSPGYEFNKAFVVASTPYNLNLSVKKGIIQKFNLTQNDNNLTSFNSNMLNESHSEHTVNKVFDKYIREKNFTNDERQQFIYHLLTSLPTF